jgi:hypothetical protein
MNQTEQLSLNLTIEEINTILEALGQRAYADVFQLVEKIKAQSGAQMRTHEPPGEATSTPSQKNKI